MDRETNEAQEKKGKGKLIGIIGAVVVVAGAAVYFLFLGGGGEAAEEEAEVAEASEPVEGAIVESEEMTVNLADNDPRYARIRFAVVLHEGSDQTAVGERFPLLKDRILDVMAGFTADELLADGGIDDVRTQLTSASQDVWPDGDVLRVLVTELLVQ